jgi:PAS domain S-box-containing protein
MAKPTQEEMVAILQGYQDKLAQAEREGKVRFEQVFASPPPGVAVHEFDTTGTVRRVNAEELKLLGYESSQVVGHAVWEFVVMQDASRQSVQKKLAGEKDIKPFVRTFRTADGSGLVLLLVDRRLQDPQGRPRGIRTAMMQLGDAEPPQP